MKQPGLGTANFLLPGARAVPRRPRDRKNSFSRSNACQRTPEGGGGKTAGGGGAKPHNPEGPARHLDVSGQKLSPHCLETIFDSQLPSPKSSPKMPPKLSLPHRRGHFFLFQNYPRGEGNCEAIERQKLSRGNFLPWDIKMSRRAHWEGDPPRKTVSDPPPLTSAHPPPMPFLL